jgi:hypothetical protein
LKQRLIGEQNRRDYENESNVDSNGSSQALNVQGAHRTKENFKRKFSGTCHNCGKIGHKKMNCWAKGGGKAGQGPKGSRQQDSKAHVSYQFSAIKNDDKRSIEREWIVDSGATDHMCATRERFTKLEKCTNRHIYLANHEKLEIEGIGEIELVFQNTKVRCFKAQKGVIWITAIS